MVNRVSTVDPQAMSEINTTPLIDVLLVLLIMFIITIPIQTHAVKLDLPAGVPEIRTDPVSNRIVVTRRDQLLWNGQAVELADLRQLLARTQQMQPLPELHIQPEAEAQYALVDQVLAETKRAKVERMGFVGNEAYAKSF